MEGKMENKLDAEMDAGIEKLNSTLEQEKESEEKLLDELFEQNASLFRLLGDDNPEETALRARAFTSALGGKSDKEVDALFLEFSEIFGTLWKSLLKDVAKRSAGSLKDNADIVREQISTSEVIAKIAAEMAKNQADQIESLLDVNEEMTEKVLGHFAVENLGSPPSVPSPASSPSFKITRSETVNSAILLEVQYRTSEDFETSEILVYDRGVTFVDLLSQGTFNPRDNTRGIVPTARFRCTKRGWELARRLTEVL